MIKEEKIILGGGCFWCLEAIFTSINGIHQVVSGYAGGHTINPTYQEVCSEKTGYAEVVQLSFDATKLPLVEILAMFWQSHDPTTLNRQGADVGTRYRSVIYTNHEEQQKLAQHSKETMDASGVFANPIVTEIKLVDQFYPAESYHQQYYQNHPNAPYCTLVIRPKLVKLGRGE